MGTDISPYPFVQGLDGNFTTYFTDYVIGILSLVFAINLYKSLKRSNELLKALDDKGTIFRDDSEDSDQSKQLVRTHFEDARSLLQSLCLAFTLCALMHTVGGMAHQSIRFMISFPEHNNHTSNSIQKEYEKVACHIIPVYILWQVAKLFASSFAMCMVYLSYRTFLCDATNVPEIYRIFSCESNVNYFLADFRKYLISDKLWGISSNLRRKNSVVAGVIFLFVIVQVLYHTVKGTMTIFGELSCGVGVSSYEDVHSGEGSGIHLDSDTMTSFFLDERFAKIWIVRDMTVALVLSLLLYAATSTALAVLHSLTRKPRCRDPLLSNTAEDSISTKVTLKEKKTVTSSFISAGTSNLPISRTKILNVHLFRCLALWTVFCGGAVQFALAQPCGTNNAVYCPLPESFNHNFLYHLFLISGSTVWYIAEDAHFKLEFEITKQIFHVSRNS